MSPGQRLRTGPGHGRLVPAQRGAEPNANGKGIAKQDVETTNL